MKKGEIMKNVSSGLSKAGFQLKKHSPEILVVAGIVGTVASAVMACRATTKAGKVLDKTKDDIDEIHNAVETGVTNAGEEYTEEDSKKDLTIVYVQTGVKIAKLYAPSVVLGTISLASIITSNGILRKRNLEMAAAYATVDKCFKDYRSRVVERFGADIDRELKNNVKATKVKVTEKDPETGEDKEVEKRRLVANRSDISGYARFFEHYTTDDNGNSIPNRNWESNNEYNMMFLRAQERFANEMLRSRGRLFLNEVYDMLGLPRTKAGQIVGWVYDPNNSKIDSYVDFGLYSNNPTLCEDGEEQAILLDFNVDGNIWDKM